MTRSLMDLPGIAPKSRHTRLEGTVAAGLGATCLNNGERQNEAQHKNDIGTSHPNL